MYNSPILLQHLCQLMWKLVLWPQAPAAAGFVLTTVEAIGDITATEEASFLATVGERHNKRIQGGLLGDGETFSTERT